MKRTLAIVGTPAVTALALLGATPAQAAEKPHHDHSTKAAQRQHDRKVERRQERRAERATPKPAQDTTTTASPLSPPRAAPRSPRGVVSCAVTAVRGQGLDFVVHNGCGTAQAVTVSVQAQPEPWHLGLCTAGGCALLNRHDEAVQPGTHTISVGSSACFYQVDLKWHGQLIRSNHFVTVCTKPKPPLPTPRAHTPVVTHHQPTHARVRLTSTPTSSSMTSLPRTGGASTALGYLGFLSLVAGGSLLLLTRHPKKVAREWSEATNTAHISAAPVNSDVLPGGSLTVLAASEIGLI